MSSPASVPGGADADGGSGPELTDDDEASVGRLRSFAAPAPGEAVAVVEHLGRAGARIVVVRPDGFFGDAVVSSLDAGEEVCRRAGIPTGEWTRELSARMRLSAQDRKRMAGTGR